MVTSFNHSGVVVEDLDAVLGFYVGLLGLEVVREVDSIAPPTGDHTGIAGARRKLVFVGVPGRDHLLELVHYIDPPSPDGHLERYQLGAATSASTWRGWRSCTPTCPLRASRL